MNSLQNLKTRSKLFLAFGVMVAMMAAVRPASGCTAVASRVTSVGPSMNTVSSTTASNAKAVCSIERSGTT